ncbi:MAG: hypothetical protein Q7J16_13745 [Candidatus Cloacimonadales bacterium]|nr:hypothetical protein [Candidatus Cloacimonadales bacterium]
MNKIIFLLLNFLLVNICTANPSLPSHLIEQSLRLEIGNYSGSGFILKDTLNVVYLVTAKHVLIDPKINKTYDDTLKIYSYPFDSSTDFQDSIYVDLNKLNNDRNILINDSDAIVLKIGMGQTNENVNQIKLNNDVFGFTSNKSINIINEKEFSLRYFDDVNIGSEILMTGYPTSLGLLKTSQYDFHRPLIRKGWIAGKNIDKKTIILDCPSYGGNSGGPVYEIVQESLFVHKYELIGIVIQFISYEDILFDKNANPRHNDISNSGYSVILSIDYIMKLIYKN